VFWLLRKVGVLASLASIISPRVPVLVIRGAIGALARHETETLAIKRLSEISEKIAATRSQSGERTWCVRQSGEFRTVLNRNLEILFRWTVRLRGNVFQTTQDTPSMAFLPAYTAGLFSNC